MKSRMSRRSVLLSGLAMVFMVSGARADQAAGGGGEHPFYGGISFVRNPALLPPPESPTDYPVQIGDAEKLPAKYRRQQVTIGSQEPAGTIIVDPAHKYLYFILGGDQAIRYGVGVGREGFAWSGRALIGMKRRWPRWVPPESMVERDIKAATWANGMPGGPENPLGARALYLNANGLDTLYRIHGTNDPSSIGKAVSSGCVRLLNEDIADLFERTKLGNQVLVLDAGTL